MFYEYEDGSIKIEYEDYVVDMYGGCDYESIYRLDKENAEKLRKHLEKTHTGSLKEMLNEEFGSNLKKKSIEKELDRLKIKYTHFTWIG